MKNLWMCLVFIGFSLSVAAQQNFIKHKVEAGETVTKIAQKYQIAPATIFRLNPDAQTGLKPDMILLIPKGNGAIIQEMKTTDSGKKLHLVSAKETVYSLTKLYNVTEEELEKSNPGILAKGLKIGDQVIIPLQKEVLSPAKSAASEMKVAKTHVVEAKETLYSISNLYHVAVEDIENLNPEIKHGLQIGFVLKIPSKKVEKGNTTLVKPNDAIISVSNRPNRVSYTVQPKETLYGIAVKTGYSQEELIALNPILKEGLKEGMVLFFPASNAINSLFNTKKQADLTETLSTKKQKKLVLLLPFNISKIESDTTSVKNRIRNDKFLNMTLDFYSGAVMAIDSAKALGLNLEIKIFDSQETKSTSNVASIFKQSNFIGTDLVIGPFYQTNVEAAAKLLMKDSIMVMSPLSKDTSAYLPNVIQTLPSDDFIKDKMFDFMRKNSSAIIGVIDTKKVATRSYFSTHQPSVKLVNFETTESTNNGIKMLLEKGKKNYIVMDTENTYRIKLLISSLISLKNDYDIQLVILDSNPKLDSDEISVESLAQLNLMYPSVAKQITANENSYFIRKYRQANTVAPSSYAVRGFDITFDAILRLSQEQDYQDTLLTIDTEQFENRFSFEKRVNKGYQNTGFYLLYYDVDLSIKNAN